MHKGVQVVFMGRVNPDLDKDDGDLETTCGNYSSRDKQTF